MVTLRNNNNNNTIILNTVLHTLGFATMIQTSVQVMRNKRQIYPNKHLLKKQTANLLNS